jgi:DNA-directed RNA polymerase subunit RPC12/RpoP
MKIPDDFSAALDARSRDANNAVAAGTSHDGESGRGQPHSKTWRTLAHPNRGSRLSRRWLTPPGFGVRLSSAALVYLLSIVLPVVGLLMSGCRRDVAAEASDSDANGYVCQNCGAKFYTDRSVFLTAKCPKCQQDGLVEVVGYECPKDHHITIRARSGDRGSPACEQCQGRPGGMLLPREKQLKAWGATKTSS